MLFSWIDVVIANLILNNSALRTPHNILSLLHVLYLLYNAGGNQSNSTGSARLQGELIFRYHQQQYLQRQERVSESQIRQVGMWVVGD